jgi:hypothetical protein
LRHGRLIHVSKYRQVFTVQRAVNDHPTALILPMGWSLSLIADIGSQAGVQLFAAEVRSFAPHPLFQRTLLYAGDKSL